MARKRSKSLDRICLPIPSAQKSPKLTSLEKCFICQKKIQDCPLRKGKSASIATFVEASKSRQDDCFRRLQREGMDNLSENEIMWHASCYASYTSQQNLKYVSSAATSQKQSNAEESVQHRQDVLAKVSFYYNIRI